MSEGGEEGTQGGKARAVLIRAGSCRPVLSESGPNHGGNEPLEEILRFCRRNAGGSMDLRAWSCVSRSGVHGAVCMAQYVTV